ncbi:hypothetical protein SO802_004761 [Lithocarpus litseifolius]|uniref:Uncharacterized protein n=1 Tax=Lithocarpus litseifolius TaxID=425828 RepID=A0AAW2DJ89_9ROSI
MQGMTQITLISLTAKYTENRKDKHRNNSYNMSEPPLPISLSTTRSESSDMAEIELRGGVLMHQSDFNSHLVLGLRRERGIEDFLVKLREITLGESSRSESSC